MSNNAPTNFKEIRTTDDLVLYLRDDVRRLANSKYIYHYTTLDRAVKILSGRKWHLGNAEFMNDKLEYQNGNKQKWPNIFFSSFMGESKESIGMWSMYAQPWSEGVKIAIPSATARRWIKEITQVEEISVTDFQPTGRTLPIMRDDLHIASVAYGNTDSLDEKEATEELTWSTVSNNSITNATHLGELTGYIKDTAWAYEKEVRIRAEFNNVSGFRRVAISIPEDILSSLIITPSPLYYGQIKQTLLAKTGLTLTIEDSLFSGRLNIRTMCDTCGLRAQASS